MFQNLATCNVLVKFLNFWGMLLTVRVSLDVHSGSQQDSYIFCLAALAESNAHLLDGAGAEGGGHT